MILNLDQNFNPFPDLQSISYESFTFSGGEPHIKIASEIPQNSKVLVTHRIRSFNDFGLLLLTIDALKRMQIKHIEVFLPYFPAARQDRVMISGEPLSVKVFAELLNQQNLQNIHVFDAHSEVTPAVLDNCSVTTNDLFIKQVLEQIGRDLLFISPDGGALKKIYKLSKELGGIEVVECSKSRDVQTGKLAAFKVYADDLQGKNCLIVDDICDGGGTFMGLAEKLNEKNAGNLFLAVSHGIFSKGFESLNQSFEHIFTTNSFKFFPNSAQFTQFQLNSKILNF